MASVYLNDVDAYNRALQLYQRKADKYNTAADAYNQRLGAYQQVVDAYNQKINNYNTAADAFNQSFYRDANGQQAGMVGGTWTQNAPSDRTGWALYTDPTNTGNQFLRRATSTADAGAAEIQNLGRGNVRVYLPGGGDFVTGWNKQQQLQNELMKRGYVAPGEFNFYSLNSGRQNLGLQRANFDNAPAAPSDPAPAPWSEAAPAAPNPFRLQKPEASASQLRRLAQPTLAQQETGLIGEVIRGHGLKA